MSKRRGRIKKSKDGNQIGRNTRRGLVLLIAFLLALILALAFRVGDAWWPVWMIEYRNIITGVLLFITALLILLSPIIIEFNSNPRHLSGPGKNPEQGWRP